MAPLSRSRPDGLSAIPFEVLDRTGSAAELHGLELPEPVTRQVWRMHVDRPALVLGSSQDRGIVDEAGCAALGIEVARRRSGGGLVLLEPGAQAWVDVLIPRHDPLWDDDVGRAFRWLGLAWQRALTEMGIRTEMVEGRLEEGPWGRLVCFAGRGPGELLVDGAKVVGMSLRRAKTGARFQTMALSRWSPENLVGLLAADAADQLELTAGITRVAAGLDQEAGHLAEALIAALGGGA